MSKMRVRVDGLDSLAEKLAELPDRTKAGATSAVDAETHDIADDMRENAPVDTGDLRDGIQAEVDGLHGVAASTARHASFVEHGTSRTAEQPYALPAAEASRQRFPRRLAEALDVELKGLAK